MDSVSITKIIEIIIRLLRIIKLYVRSAESCPTLRAAPPVETTRKDPKESTKIILTCRHSCIIGLLSARILSALVKSFCTSSDAARNFPFSYPSRTNAFTTRMALTFSCTDSLSLSYFLNTRLKSGMVFRITKISPSASTGTSITKIHAMRPPIMKAIANAKMSIKGALTAMRMSMLKAKEMLVTSVVSLVTSDDVENLSIFSKE